MGSLFAVGGAVSSFGLLAAPASPRPWVRLSLRFSSLFKTRSISLSGIYALNIVCYISLSNVVLTCQKVRWFASSREDGKTEGATSTPELRSSRLPSLMIVLIIVYTIILILAFILLDQFNKAVKAGRMQEAMSLLKRNPQVLTSTFPFSYHLFSFSSHPIFSLLLYIYIYIFLSSLFSPLLSLFLLLFSPLTSLFSPLLSSLFYLLSSHLFILLYFGSTSILRIQ